MGDADLVISDQDRRAYLLGTADLKTTYRIELEILRGGKELERLEHLEDELIDEYVFGRLPDEESLRFWDHFLCTQMRKSKLDVANELRSWATSQSEDSSQLLPERSHISPMTWRIAAGLAVCTLIVFSIWLGISNARLRLQLASARHAIPGAMHAKPTTEGAPLGGQLESKTQQQETLAVDRLDSRIAEATLAPGLTRSIQVSQLVRVSPGTMVVLLTLESLSERRNSESRHKLFNASRECIWSQNLPDRGHVERGKTIVAIPAAILGAGDCRVTLEARNSTGSFEDVDSYSFRVLKD